MKTLTLIIQIVTTIGVLFFVYLIHDAILGEGDRDKLPLYLAGMSVCWGLTTFVHLRVKKAKAK